MRLPTSSLSSVFLSSVWIILCFCSRLLPFDSFVILSSLLLLFFSLPPFFFRRLPLFKSFLCVLPLPDPIICLGCLLVSSAVCRRSSTFFSPFFRGGLCAACVPPPPSSISASPFLLLFFSSILPGLLSVLSFGGGGSSLGAEIQFRSSRSAFSASTGSDGERGLSYLLPTQIERPGAGSSPCFHAVLSGCYSGVLRAVIGAYGGARRRTAR